jgi:hypothetical protein
MSTPLLDIIFAPDPLSIPPEQLSGPELAQSGIRQAYMNAPDALEWKYIVAVSRAQIWTKLTSEDLRKWCGDPPNEHNNILAGVLAFCRGQKLIEFTDETKRAERPSIHGKIIHVHQRTDTRIAEDVLKKTFIEKKEKARRAEAKKKLSLGS